MTTSQQFPEFLRLHGVLRVAELADPEPIIVKKLPISSAIHYLGNDVNPALDVSDPLMLGYTDRVRYYNVTSHNPDHNAGTRKLVDMSQINAIFDKNNSGFKVMRDLKDYATLPSKQLMVINYGYLDEFYSTNSKLGEYQVIESKLWSLVMTLKEMNKLSKRNHFILLDVPTMLIPKTILDQRSLDEPTKLSGIFKTLDQHILRHIWLFLNPGNQTRSIWGDLDDDLKRQVNLVWRTFDGKCSVVNLGYLYSWVQGNPNLTLTKSVLTKDYTEVQKTFLRGNMVLQTIDANGASMKAQEEAQNQQLAKLEKEEALSEGEASEKDDRFHQDREYDQAAVQAETRLRQISSQLRSDPAADDGAAKRPGDDPDPVDAEAVSAQAIEADISALEEVYAKRIASIRLTSMVKANVAPTETNPDAQEEVKYSSDVPETAEEIRAALFTSKTPEQALRGKLDKLVADGGMSAVDFRKKSQLIAQSSKIPDPYGSGKTIVEAAVVTKEELTITDEEAALAVPETVIDKSMARASLGVMAAKYNNSTIYKDILNCVQHAQKGGIILRNHHVDRIDEITGSFEYHTLELVPLRGQPSIIRCKIPVVSDEGTFTTRGNISVLRRQFVDRPIRKIGPNRVALSSYDKKTFIDRATKKANSSLEYVLTRLSKATISPDEHLRDVAPGDVFDNYFEAPYIYSGISERVVSFKAGDATFDFNHKGFRASLDPEIIKTVEKNGSRICGWIAKGKKALVIVDKNDNFFAIRSDSVEPLGDIYTVLKMDKTLAPVDFAEVKVFSQGIPVGVFLGQTIGFKKLVKMLGARHRLVEGKQRKQLEDWEYVVQFRDVAYIFDRRDVANSLVLAGYRMFEKETKLFDAELFDAKDIYVRLLEAKGLSTMYLLEMESLQDMFIDPITERILKEMGEPTTFNGLLIRACELLTTYYYPSSQDANQQRIRGYDRFAGFFYKELTSAIRTYKSKNRTGRAKVEMSPFQLYTTLTRDSAVKHAEDINPIQSLKISEEAVTYVGEGGRGKESMNKASRAYVISNLGTLSEASVDSSDVGINAFLSADPGFANTDGISKPNRPMQATNLFSTSTLLSPYATNDDMKRVGFISVQQGHTIATEGYEPSMIRTGYESVIGKRTNGMFAKVAKQDGVVTSVTPKGIIVKYKDGTEKGFALGTLYGKAEGSIYPHTLVTELQVGQKFKKDDYITYNTKFFVPDPVLPGSIVYKGNMMVRVALMEVAQTHEDSSTISESLSERLKTSTIKPKVFTVNFRENVTDVVKVGQKLKPEDILLTIEDEITAMDDSFKSASLQILAARAKNSPRSEYVGTVSDIEVLYHGDMDDMSPGLRALTQKSNKVKSEEARSRGLAYSTGAVDSEYSVNGTPLSLNKAVIKIYLNVPDNLSSGDKVTFCHQIKSVVGEVMPYTLRTESGEIVDAKIGARSFAARIVSSLINIGTRSTTLDALGVQGCKIYRGQ